MGQLFRLKVSKKINFSDAEVALSQLVLRRHPSSRLFDASGEKDRRLYFWKVSKLKLQSL
jgi:hypothetical protein